MTPNQRHQGLDKAILENRKAVIEQAKARYPECWCGRKTRNLDHINVVYLNPGKATGKTAENTSTVKKVA